MNSTEKGDLGEKAVNTLAFETYLKYWCFPNPKDEKGSKKEICDLLILFRSTAIIISIKNYSFNGNYERYFRSTLDKAISQIQGAERKLFNNNQSVYIKHPDLDEQKFNSREYTNIFRIVININTTPLFYPVGRMSKNGYVHIFNWESFFKLVIELDTIPDFIEYLKVRQDLFYNKEALLLLGKEEQWESPVQQEFIKYMDFDTKFDNQVILISGDEMDLLADYYYNERKFGSHFFNSNYDGLQIEIEGKWNKYISRKDVERKKVDDKLSYFIDEFVKREVLYKSDTYNIEIATELLSLSRFERRLAGKQFFDFVNKYENQNGFFTARRFGKIGDITIGFMLYGAQMEDEQVLKLMEILIEGYCIYNKYRDNKILLISVSNKLNRFKYGFFKDITPFSPDDEESVKHDLKLLNWFENLEEIHFSLKEYPDQ